MAGQLSLLEPTAGREELWFRVFDLLGRPAADVPVHECLGGWSEAEKWCYVAVAEINAAIRFAWQIEAHLVSVDDKGADSNPRTIHSGGQPPCCPDGPFDRHLLAHLVTHCA
jgi:hypothetical protein